jgi:FMN phosphatase YigB (HAD superfamily)
VQELKEMLSESLKVDNEIFDYLRAIRASGLQLGILSNHSKYWMSTFITKFGLVPTFDAEMIINSQEVAHRKPDPKIYQILIDRVQSHISKDISPNQIVFIGNAQN